MENSFRREFRRLVRLARARYSLSPNRPDAASLDDPLTQRLLRHRTRHMN